VVLCNIIAMCVSGIVNFVLTNNLVFRRSSHKQKRD
jgi:putative flippase GtrA